MASPFIRSKAWICATTSTAPRRFAAALDLVLSAPTAAAATAASVGAEVWFLTAGRTWPQLGTDEYPWYAKTRVFSPEKFGDWAELMPPSAPSSRNSRVIKPEGKRPSPGFRFPARFHGAADIAPIRSAVDVRPFHLAARHLAKGIFQDQFAMGFIAALDGKAQADVIAGWNSKSVRS